MRFTSLRTGRGALIVNCDPVTTISHRRAVAEARTIFTLTGRDGQREVRGLPVEHEHQRRTPLSIWWSRTGVRAIVPYVRLRLPSHLLFSPSRILSATYNNYYAHPYSCADNTQISVSLSLRAPQPARTSTRTAHRSWMRALDHVCTLVHECGIRDFRGSRLSDFSTASLLAGTHRAGRFERAGCGVSQVPGAPGPKIVNVMIVS